MAVVDPQMSELASVHNAELDVPHGGPEQQQQEPDADETDVATDDIGDQSEAGDQVTYAASVEDKSTVTNATSSKTSSSIKGNDDDDATPHGVTKPTSKPSIATRKPMSSTAPKTDSTTSVKKIIGSGTFGVGSIKPAPGVKSATSGGAVGAKPAVSATGLTKSMSAAPAAKTATATRTVSGVSATPGRRASTAPAAPAAARRPLSSSVSAKPAAAEPAKLRSSIASPTSTVASSKPAATRPRASVSEAVKKPTTTATKPATTTTRTATTARPSTTTRPSATSRASVSSKTPTSASIGSIKELKSEEDVKALQELRGQLKHAEELLKEKEEAVVGLEKQLEEIQTSLKEAQDDVEAKNALAVELEKAMTDLEAQLQQLQESVSRSDGAQGEQAVELQRLKDELEAAKKVANEKSGEVEILQIQITDLEAAVTSAKAELDFVQASHTVALADAQSARSVEHEALLKAQADFKAISEENTALTTAYREANEKANATISDLEAKFAQSAALQDQVDAFKVEKEDTANKVSELEVEILELKEQIEEFQEAKEQQLATVKSLEEQLAASAKFLEETTQAAGSKEAELQSQIVGLRAKHEQELKEAEERYQALQERVAFLQGQLSAALDVQEKAVQDAEAARVSHEAQVKQLEEAHAANEAELATQIASISETLQSQEAIYAAKVQVVKDEHDQLLKEAFERAKSEAGSIHAQQLQALRNESEATIKQIQAANQITLESIKNDSSSSLESTISEYTKKINSLTLELKATKDDLAKAKSVVEVLRQETESIAKQRDEARAAANTPTPVPTEHLEEVARLSKELSNTKDDLAAVTEMLNLTKSSLQEMSDKHQKDIQEAAQTRADEIIKIKHAHDEEMTSLAAQKSELLVKLSDLQGELSTVKADLAAAQNASPKPNGATHQPSASGVTKEDLAKLHEAHNLKIHDLEAEHEKAMKVLREELEAALEKTENLNAEVARKAMEIQYLEQEQDENQEEIRQLTEDLEAARKGTAAALPA